MRQRRTPQMCIEEFFTLLKEKGPQSIQNICKELGFGWEQLDSYIQLIKYIQDNPLLVDKKIGDRTRIIYLEKKD
ncbi:MAG: hypothetical protein GF308_10335 [Candidatus Heimdallarchaeota archaeon]|nr:hypothetical protein [Candidatus Heimdallarchaeota archaeon]